MHIRTGMKTPYVFYYKHLHFLSFGLLSTGRAGPRSQVFKYPDLALPDFPTLLGSTYFKYYLIHQIILNHQNDNTTILNLL